MSDTQDRDQKTEQATPRRLEEARRKGQVPRSRDLNSAVVLLAGGVGLQALGGLLGGRLSALMRESMQFSRAEAMDVGQMTAALGDAAWAALLACAPILAVLLAAAVAAPLSIGGWNLSTEALGPKWDRLDPIAGLKRLFSIQGLVELGKSLAKFGVVAAVAAALLWSRADELLALGREPLQQAVGDGVRLAGFALIALAGSLVLIALVDVPLQLWQHARSLRMSREEIKQEHKETEGNPELKAHIRSRQQQLARNRMMQDVPKADVVVMNPTHYAVALRYDEHRMRAPVVVAKGTDLVALRIREIAEAHAVPVLEAPPLARALHRHTGIGEAIPAQLYTAVAQVLAWVYQLRAARRTGDAAPPAPSIEL